MGRINENDVFSIKSLYCVNMVSVTSASRYITSASRYQPRYHSRSSMYIRGLIPRNFAELAEAVTIAYYDGDDATEAGTMMVAVYEVYMMIYFEYLHFT